VREVQRGFLIGGILGCVWYVTIPLLGMLGYAYYGPGQKPEDVFLTLASRQFPPVVYALLVVLLLAAIMSTLASVLMSSARISSSTFTSACGVARLLRNVRCWFRVFRRDRTRRGIVFAFVFSRPARAALDRHPHYRVHCRSRGRRALPIQEGAPRAQNGPDGDDLWRRGHCAGIRTGFGTKAAVVVLWGIDPIYVGLPVNILVLVIGTYLETRKLSREDVASVTARPQAVPDALMDEELPRFNPYLAMAITVGAMFVYYVAWIAALRYL